MVVGLFLLFNDIFRNFLICNCESKLGRVLNKFGMCFVENNILYFISVNISFLIKIMIFEFFDVCVFIMLIIVVLLEWKIIYEFCKMWFYIFIVIIIGNNFFRVILYFFIFFG